MRAAMAAAEVGDDVYGDDPTVNALQERIDSLCDAARSLLLPRRRPGQRLPLWVQRRKSADLLSLASEFPDFPVVLETYRECLRDKFDLAGLTAVLRDIAKQLGDVLWYLTQICTELDLTLEEVAEANLTKLFSRLDRGKIGGDGDHR